MLTVHTAGGKKMLEAAAQAASQQSEIFKVRKPSILGITVLTSDENADNIQHTVLERARLAKQCGLDGVVASGLEAASIRKALGEKFIIVTPGIRPAGASANDQERVTTAKEAVKNGSNFLVVGRPVVKAPNPLAAAREILKEIK
jgi:orotidine-5'-phosphate decarboxylase